MGIEDFKEKYCKHCSSSDCELKYNINREAQCVNYEKQNSK